MHKMIKGAAVASAFTGLVAVGATSASAGSPTASAATTTYAASAAYATAAQQPEREADAKPAAIPAVVGTAFVSGAAAGAGKVVAGWAAKKVIGIWSVEKSTLEVTDLD